MKLFDDETRALIQGRDVAPPPTIDVARAAASMVAPPGMISAINERIEEAKAREAAWERALAEVESSSLGRIAYEAYGAARGWKAYNDTPIPQWEEAKPGIRDAWEVAAAVVTRKRDGDAETAANTARASMALGPFEEPIYGRFWGAVNVESDDSTPLFLFAAEDAAWAEIERRKALPEEDDDQLSDHYQALPFDIEGVFWNSFDPNPRPAPTESRIWEMQQEIERLTRELEKSVALLDAKGRETEAELERLRAEVSRLESERR